VYSVRIDAEQQRVTVSSDVEPATLIKKLRRSGKHAKLWSEKSNQNQKQKNNCINNDKSNRREQQGDTKGLEPFKNQQKLPNFVPEEGEAYFDDKGDDQEDEKMRFIMSERANQMGMQQLLKQQAAEANAKRNSVVGGMKPDVVPNSRKVINHVENSNAGKKGNLNLAQNVGINLNNPGGVIDPRTMMALKMNMVVLW
ncbi:hypothetical protein Dimus_013805, partial [Dionaea muscipula]